MKTEKSRGNEASPSKDSSMELSIRVSMAGRQANVRGWCRSRAGGITKVRYCLH